MSSTVTKPRGRHFFANPGPTNIPDSVLRALDRPSIDFHDPDFVEVYDAAFAGVKRVLKTQHHLFMYNASGHGAWEASLTNLLSPGYAILVLPATGVVAWTPPRSSRHSPPTRRIRSRRYASCTTRPRPA